MKLKVIDWANGKIGVRSRLKLSDLKLIKRVFEVSDKTTLREMHTYWKRGTVPKTWKEIEKKKVTQ